MSAHFDRQYRKHGLEKVQRYLLEGLRSELNSGSSLLDIGCGVGALHLALLREGASGAVGVELSEGMIDRARRHAADLGMAEKTVYLQGDFVERASELGQSDVTLLDKVVCCYPDIERLLESSLSKTTHLLAMTHPRTNLLSGFLFKTHIICARLFRLSFHPFWHDWEAMTGTIRSRGFELVYARATPVWQALVYKRTASETAASVKLRGFNRP